MPLTPKKKNQIEKTEKRIHKLEERNPDKVERIRKNLKSVGYTPEEIMKAVPRLPKDLIDTLSLIKEPYINSFERGDLGIRKILDKAGEES